MKINNITKYINKGLIFVLMLYKLQHYLTLIIKFSMTYELHTLLVKFNIINKF